jgi:hypothetical protein
MVSNRVRFGMILSALVGSGGVYPNRTAPAGR